MAADYATVADLQSHWPGMSPEQAIDAAQKLHEASIEVRALYPDVDARIASGALDPEAVTLVVCRMVKRSMNVAPELENVSQTNQQAGPFGMQTTFRSTDGNLYLTKSDKRLLGKTRNESPFSFLPG